MWTREQQPTESVDAYITDIINTAKIVPVNDVELLRFAVIKGLRNDIKLHVLQSGATSLDAVTKAARVAEAALAASSSQTSDVSELTRQVTTLIEQIKAITCLKTTRTSG